MKKILVTGAGGFVGSYLIRELAVGSENEIFATVYKETSDITTLLPADHIIAGDLTDFAFTEKLIEQVQPDLIYHLAAISTVHNSAQFATKVMTDNTTLQYNLLESTRLHAPQARFIAISSANIYGQVENFERPITEETPLRPLNPYAVSKISQEMLALEYYLANGLDIVIIRPFNHTGPGQTIDFVVPALAKQFAEIVKAKHSRVIEIGNTENVRDFTDVTDMVKAYILAAQMGKSGEIYNIGSGVGVKVSEIVGLFKKISGIDVQVDVKREIVRTADVPSLICDATKFRTLTGWSPKIPLETTLTNVYNYWKEQI